MISSAEVGKEKCQARSGMPAEKDENTVKRTIDTLTGLRVRVGVGHAPARTCSSSSLVMWIRMTLCVDTSFGLCHHRKMLTKEQAIRLARADNKESKLGRQQGGKPARQPSKLNYEPISERRLNSQLDWGPVSHFRLNFNMASQSSLIVHSHSARILR
jgi:hypothetical protein